MNQAITPMPSREVSLDEAMHFVWTEADMLDQQQYEDWLALWTPEGRYVIPIEPEAVDFDNTLNYAYDDAAMRKMRVDRLRGGLSISAVSAARTIRSVSRFRLLQSAAGICELRCAQLLVEYRRQQERSYAADLTYRLCVTDEGLRLDRKIIRLINATDALGAIGYLM